MAISTNLSDPDLQLRAVAEVRNAVGEPHIILSDEACLSHLKMAGAPPTGEVPASRILRGAALALNAIANSEAYVQKVITTLDLTTDGRALADSYRSSARDLRGQARELEAEAIQGVLSAAVPQARPRHTAPSRRIDAYSGLGNSEHVANEPYGRRDRWGYHR